MLRTVSRLGLALLLVGGAVLGGWFWMHPSTPPQERRIEMTARQYAYDPPTIQVNEGDTVRLRITSLDVVHGFYLEAFDIDARIVPQSPYIELSRPSRPDDPPRKVDEITFTANREGKYRYRCSHTCGSMHPFMNGELVVAPNRLFGAGLGGMIGLVVAGAVLAAWGTRKGAQGGAVPSGAEAVGHGNA